MDKIAKQNFINAYLRNLKGDNVKKAIRTYEPIAKKRNEAFNKAQELLKNLDALKAEGAHPNYIKTKVTDPANRLLGEAERMNSRAKRVVEIGEKAKHNMDMTRRATGVAVAAPLVAGTAYAVKKRQEKTAEYKEGIYKEAGVEYGYTAYKENDEKLFDDLSRANIKDDWDKEDDIRSKLKGRSPQDYGYPEWSEKANASIPWDYDVPELHDFMNGKGTNKLKGYRPLTNPYSGENDGANFLAGRESAEKMVKMYDNLLAKMPKDSVFDQKKYDEAVKNRDALNEKLRGQRKINEAEIAAARNEIVNLQAQSNSTKKQIKDTFVLNIPKRIKLRSELGGIKNSLAAKHHAISRLENRGISQEDLANLEKYRKVIYQNAADADIVRLYNQSLKKSLADGNNMYEWGWK